MLKIPSNKKNIAAKQNILLHSLEGIGDILVFETKRQKNKLVLEGLKKIGDSVKRLFEIQQHEPEKFHELILSQELIDLFEHDEKEAQMRLAFNPEDSLLSFTSAINQIVRVYESAIQSKNEEISRYAVYHINWILASLASSKENAIFIEQLLRKLADITITAVRENDNSAYAATIHWYTDIVFNRLGDKKDFNIQYLDLFDKYFFAAVKYIITKGQTEIFHSLVKSLVDGIHYPSYHQGEIWSYGHLLMHGDFEKYNQLDKQFDIEKKIAKLADSELDIISEEKLTAWLTNFDELKSILEPQLSVEQKKRASEMEEQILEFAYSHYKYQNLLAVVFAINAFCLFKKRYDYIRYLWDYKQPLDSDASWIGHDISPRSIEEVIRLYFRKSLFEKKFHFWEDHHGSEKYYKQYFLLLLSRKLYRERDSGDSVIEKYTISTEWSTYRLSNIEHSVQELKALIPELKASESSLLELGFEMLKIQNIFDEKLTALLDKMQSESEKAIAHKHKTGVISKNKLNEFKTDLIERFYSDAILRDIFVRYFKKYKNAPDKGETDKKERFVINTLDDKAAFFNEWYVHYSGWGENYGRDIASSEDEFLWDEISNKCTEVKSTDIETVLSNFESLSDVVILANTGSMWKFLEKEKNYTPKWHANTAQLDIHGFEGWYKLREHSIPVFSIHHRKKDRQILIVDKKNIGSLLQMSPLNKGDNSELLHDVFFINIRAFSENPELIEQYIKEPPKWLNDKGDETAQKEYLKEMVVVYICERLRIESSESFRGYRFTVSE